MEPNIHIQLTGAVLAQVHIAGNNKSNKINTLQSSLWRFSCHSPCLKKKTRQPPFQSRLSGFGISKNHERFIRPVLAYPYGGRRCAAPAVRRSTCGLLCLGLIAPHVRVGDSDWDYLQFMFGWAMAFGIICTSSIGGRWRLGLFASHIQVSDDDWGYLHLMFGWAMAIDLMFV